MKIKKKTLSILFFTLVALLFIMPVSADVNITSGSELADFLNDTTETVGNVTSDLTLQTNVSPLPAMTKTLNLNGYTIYGGGFLFGEPFKLENSGTVLTINGDNGTITSPMLQYLFVVEGGTLNINNVKFSQCQSCISITDNYGPHVNLTNITFDNPISFVGGIIRCYGNNNSMDFNMENVTFINLNDVSEALICHESRYGTMTWDGGTITGSFVGNGCLMKNTNSTSTEFIMKNIEFKNITTTNPLTTGSNTCDKYKFINCDFINITCNDSSFLNFQQSSGDTSSKGEFKSCNITNCKVNVSGTSNYPLIKFNNIDSMSIDDLTVNGFTSNSYGIFEFVGNSSSTSSIEISSLNCTNCTVEKEFTIIKTENINSFDFDSSEIHDCTLKSPIIVTSNSDACAYNFTSCYFYNLHMDFAIPDYPAIMGFDNNNGNIVMDDIYIHDNDVVSGKYDAYYSVSIKNANTNLNNVIIKNNDSAYGFGLSIGNCTHTSTSSNGIVFTENNTKPNSYSYVLHLTNDNYIPIKCNNNIGYDYGIVVDNHTSNGLTFKNITLDSTNYGKNTIYIDSSQSEPNPTHLVTFNTCTFTNNTNNSATEPVLVWSGYGEGIGFTNCTISGNTSTNTTNKKVIELFNGNAVIGDNVNFASDNQTIYLHDNTYVMFATTSPTTPLTKVRILLQNQDVGDRITNQTGVSSTFSKNDIKIISDTPYVLRFNSPDYYLDIPKTSITILGGDIIGVGSVEYPQKTITLTTIPSAEGLYFKGIYSDVTYSKKIAEADGTLIPNVSGYTDGFGRWICEDLTLATTGLFEPPEPTAWQKTLNNSTSGMTAAMIIGALASLILSGIMLFQIIRTGHISLPLLIGMGACILICFIIAIVAGNLDATGLDMFKPKGL